MKEICFIYFENLAKNIIFLFLYFFNFYHCYKIYLNFFFISSQLALYKENYYLLSLKKTLVEIFLLVVKSNKGDLIRGIKILLNYSSFSFNKVFKFSLYLMD